MKRFFERDIWEDLLKWKNTSKATLEVHGARQIGKTTVLKKFCKEEFVQVVYINMADNTGKRFLSCIEEWHDKYFRIYTDRTWMPELFKLYRSDFVDAKSTVILIDEIQESPRVYNLIRNITRDMEAKCIVTGNYLGKLLDRDFFLPAGDVEQLTMYSLSFSEFLAVFGKRDLQKECYDNRQTNDELKLLFEIYLRVGGYPAVVQEFLNTKDFHICSKETRKIIDTFISESRRYFDAIEDDNGFKRLLGAIAEVTINEKEGNSLIKDLQKILKNDKIELSREVLLRAVSWLESSGIIGYTTKLIDGKVQQRSMRMRYYFQDMGVASCFSYAAFADDAAKRGYLAENYVYIVIRNKFYKGAGYSLDLLGEEPMFTTLTNPKGELDFILCHIDSHKKIGIEVKSGKNKANTGQRMLDNNMIDQLYLLKGRQDVDSMAM